MTEKEELLQAKNRAEQQLKQLVSCVFVHVCVHVCMCAYVHVVCISSLVSWLSLAHVIITSDEAEEGISLYTKPHDS